MHDLGLYATLRVGPYVCAEWEDGGYPIWFMQKPGLSLRDTNEVFLAGSDEWYSHVMPIVASNQINHAGSVILVQLENEHIDCWGTDTNGLPYFQHLRTNALSLGLEVPMFFSGLHHNSDPAGTTPWDSVERDSPWYSTEFWVVWYDKYGETAANVAKFDRDTWKIIAYGGNGYNYYMYHGGTDFDHWNNNEDASSYDYGAAVGQAGDLRPLYYRFKRAALFARTFQSILESSTNATTGYSGSASGVAVTARGSAAGSILFLDNDSRDAVTSTLADNAQIKLDPYEIAAVVKDFPLAPGVTLEEADGRILGTQNTGATTTLVLYGQTAEMPEVRFLLAEPCTNHAAAFVPDPANPNRQVLNPTKPDLGPDAKQFSAGAQTIRVLVMSKTMADRTWFVDSARSNYIVCGPDYVGEFTNANNQLSLTLEEPLGSALPTNIVAYDSGTAPRALAIVSHLSAKSVTAPMLSHWQMRSAATPAAPGFDDSRWLASTNPPPMGADGDPGAYAWYRAQVTAPAAGTYHLQFAGIADSGELFVNGEPVRLTQPVSQASVTLQAGVNTLAIFTSHSGRNKFFSMFDGPASVGFEPKGLLSPVAFSAASMSSAAIRNWYWKIAGADDPTGDAAQMADPNLDPVAHGWSAGPGWNKDVFNNQPGYAWFRTTLPASTDPHHAIRFANVDDNAVVYLNGANVQGTHGGWGLPFVVNLDSAWNPNGANVLTVLVHNRGGGGGINGTVTFQNFGAEITGWKMRGGVGEIDGPNVCSGA